MRSAFAILFLAGCALLAGCSDTEPSLEGQWRLVKSSGRDAAFEGFKLQGNNFEISAKATVSGAPVSVACSFKSTNTKEAIGISSPAPTNSTACPNYSVSFRVDRKNENTIQLSIKTSSIDFDAIYERVVASSGSSAIDGLRGEALKGYFAVGRPIGIAKEIALTQASGSTLYFTGGSIGSVPPSSGSYCVLYLYEEVKLRPSGTLRVDSAPYSSTYSISLYLRYAAEGENEKSLSFTCYGAAGEVTGKDLSTAFQSILNF